MPRVQRRCLYAVEHYIPNEPYAPWLDFYLCASQEDAQHRYNSLSGGRVDLVIDDTVFLSKGRV